MFSIVDVGIRGVVSMISTRHAKPNSPYMTAFDPARPTWFIIYLDPNNLSEWAMSQPMPISSFAWMTAAEALEIDRLAQTDEQPLGYFVEARIHNLVELHEAQNDDPLAPQRLDVQGKMLIDNQVELRILQNVTLGSLEEAHSKPAAEEQVPGALPQPALLYRAWDVLD